MTLGVHRFPQFPLSFPQILRPLPILPEDHSGQALDSSTSSKDTTPRSSRALSRKLHHRLSQQVQIHIIFSSDFVNLTNPVSASNFKRTIANRSATSILPLECFFH
mmetsp:Transcript_30907/g.66233  ORF Transcript_30907/g.66233 Transcript_30907/m.66233 type:complete len:106 (+) Transcript_30907:134-451(+)